MVNVVLSAMPEGGLTVNCPPEGGMLTLNERVETHDAAELKYLADKLKVYVSPGVKEYGLIPI